MNNIKKTNTSSTKKNNDDELEKIGKELFKFRTGEEEKKEAIKHFQVYSGEIISRMSNLGFVVKTLCFSFLSLFLIFISIININELNLWIKILIIFISDICIFIFSLFNNYFLKKEKKIRTYQKNKIERYENLTFKEIIIFDLKETKKKKEKCFFSFTIFGFYFPCLIINTIILGILLFII